MDKKTTIMLGLFVLLLAGVIGAKVAMRPAGDRKGDRPRPLPALKAADIDDLEITMNKQTTKLKKSGETWAVVAPVSYAADAAAVKTALEKIEALAFEGTVTDRAEKHLDYEVTDEKGVRIVARKGSAVLADFLIGKIAGGVTMFRLSGKNEVWRAVGSLRYVFGKETKSWRDHEVITFKRDDVEKVELETAAGKVVCKREPGEKGKPDKWTILEAPVKIEKPDDAVPAGIMSTMMSLRAFDFADGAKPEESGLDRPAATATTYLKGGATKKVLVGKAKGDQFYIKVPDRDQVFLVSKYSVERLTKKPIDFRDKSIVDVKPEQIASVQIDFADKKIELQRAGEDWKATAPADLVVDPNKAKAVVSGFTNLKAYAFADEAFAKEGMAKPAGSVTVRLKDKTSFTLKFGALKEQDYPVQKVGTPEVFVLKKYAAERFLKKPEDLKKTEGTSPPRRPGMPPSPVKVQHHGVPGKAPMPGKAPVPIKAPPPVKAPAPVKEGGRPIGPRGPREGRAGRVSDAPARYCAPPSPRESRARALLRAAVPGWAVLLLVQEAQRLCRGPLLGLLLAPPAAARDLAPGQSQRHLEDLVVIGAGLPDDAVARRTVQLPLRPLLQAGLEVDVGGVARLPQPGVEELPHHAKGGVEPTVEVDRGRHGLAGVGEERRLVASPGLLLPLAEEEPLAEAQLIGDSGQAGLVDHQGPAPRQLPLGAEGLALHEEVAHRQVEDRVAEELEPLVVLPVRRRVLVEVRRVGERHLEQTPVPEVVAESGLEDVVVVAWGSHRPRRRSIPDVSLFPMC